MSVDMVIGRTAKAMVLISVPLKQREGEREKEKEREFCIRSSGNGKTWNDCKSHRDVIIYYENLHMTRLWKYFS